MLPILISIGPVTIYTLGFLAFIGAVMFGFVVWRRLSDLGYKEEKVIDMVVVMGLFGVCVARIGYVVTNLTIFGEGLTRILLVTKYPGFSLWGLMIGMFWGLRWYTKKEKWDFWQVADEITYGCLPLYAILALGCFLDGSILGKATAMPWGVYFPGSLLRRQPISLFLSLGLIGIWLILLKIERKWRLWKWYRAKQDGLIFLLFLEAILGVSVMLAFWKETRLYLQGVEVVFYLTGIAISSYILYNRIRIKKAK